MGMASLVTLLVLKYASQNPTWNQRYPSVKWLRVMGPCLVTVVSIVLTFTLNLDTRGIRVIGSIPPGLPKVTIDQWMPLSSQLWVRILDEKQL